MSDVEFTLTAVDRASAALRQIEARLAAVQQRAAQMADRTAGRLRGLDTALKGVERGFASVLSTVQKIATGVVSALGNIVGAASRLASTILGSVVGAFGRLASAAGTVGAAIAAALGAAFLGAAKNGVEFNLSLRGVQAGLTAILGSSEKASGLLAGLKGVAKDTQLTFKEVAREGLGLAAAYGPAGVGRVIPTLRAFDAVQKGLMIGADGVQRALLGLRQTIGRPFAQQEDLNQVSENLPGLDVRGILTARFGTADTESLKAARVSGRQVADAIVDGMQARFGSLSGARGLGVIFSGFGDVFDELSGRLTQRLLPRLEAFAERALAAFGKLAANERFVRALSVPFEILGRVLDSVNLDAFTDWLARIVTRENVVKVLGDVAGWVETIKDKVVEFLGALTGGQSLGGAFTTMADLAEAALDRILQGFGYLAGVIQHLFANREALGNALKDALAYAGAVLETAVGVLAGVLAGKFVAEFSNGLKSLIPDWLQRIAGGSPLAGGGAVRKSGFLGGGGGASGGIGGDAASGLLPAVTGADPRLVRGAGRAPGDAVTFPGPAGIAQGLGRGVIGTGRGLFDAAMGQVPPGLGGFFAGLDAAGRRGAGSFSLAQIRRQQEEAARRARARIGGLLPGSGRAGDALAPSHQIGVYQGGGGAPGGVSDEEFKDLQKRRGLYFDVLREQAKVAAAGAPEGREALAEANRLIPIAQQELETVVMPALRRAKSGTEEWYRAFGEGVKLEGEIADLRRKAAKEQAEQATKSAREAKEISEARLRLFEAQVKNLPGLSERQREQALLPGLIQRYRELQQGAPGEKESERLGRLTEAEGVKGRILDAVGAGGKGGLRLLGNVDPRLMMLRKAGVFRGLNEDQERALFGGGTITGADPGLRAQLDALFTPGGAGGGGGGQEWDPAANARHGALRYALHHNAGGGVNPDAVAALANGRGRSAQIVVNVSGYTAEDIRRQADAAIQQGLRQFDPSPSPYD